MNSQTNTSSGQPTQTSGCKEDSQPVTEETNNSQGNVSQEESQPTQEIRISQVKNSSIFEQKTNPWGIVIYGVTQKELLDKEFLIGRSPECNLVIDKKDISRNHCKIIFEKGKNNKEDEAFLEVLTTQKVPSTFIADKAVCIFI